MLSKPRHLRPSLARTLPVARMHIVIPEPLIRAEASAARAKAGDPRLLFAREKAGEILSPDEKIILAKMRAGKPLRPRGRPPQMGPQWTLKVAFFILVQEGKHGGKTEHAIAKAEAHFGKPRRRIFEALNRVKSDPERWEAVQGFRDVALAMDRGDLPPDAEPAFEVKLAVPTDSGS